MSEQGIGMVSDFLQTTPAGGMAGIIAAGKKPFARLNIKEVYDKAKDMFSSGKTNREISYETQDMLRKARNPGGATSVFIGPDGVPRLVIDDTAARLSEYAFKSGLLQKDKSGNIFSYTGTPVNLSDVYIHPSLYEVSDRAKSTGVIGDTDLDRLLVIMGGGRQGGYSPETNTMSISSQLTGPGKSPLENIDETIRHEGTHILQTEMGVGGGTAPRKEALLKYFKNIKPLSKEEANTVNDAIVFLDNTFDKLSDEGKEAALDKYYKGAYGEWEARAGSEYAPYTPAEYMPEGLYGASVKTRFGGLEVKD
jgi:hypothetical protein